MLDTPLMLSIAALAYQGASPADLVLAGSLEERHQQLFSRYVEVMFERRGKQSRYSRGQTLVWLRWLGSSLLSQSRSVFHLEDLGPDWLSTRSRQRWARLLPGLVTGLVGGLVGGLVVGLFFGLGVGLGNLLESGFVGSEVTTRSTPNEGTRRSRSATYWKAGLSVLRLRPAPRQTKARGSQRNAMVSGLVGGLFFGLVGGLFFGLVGGLAVGLLKGGAFVVQHFSLRFLLWKYDHAPLDYVRLLESAKDLIFLRRIGGGYIFIHRSLLEYFAALSEDDIRRLSAEKATE